MKCKWYAEFEGVCTNGECPYRGDTCPTSEHPEVCKYAEEAQWTELNAEELVTALRFCAGTECEGCPCVYIAESGGNCDDYVKRKAADMLEKLAAEKDAKNLENRVLTLEEARNAEVDTFGTAMHWLELKIHPCKVQCEEIRCAVLAVSIFFEDQSEDGEPDAVYSYADRHDEWLIQQEYGKRWRCWLRKPTKEEMEATPWES